MQCILRKASALPPWRIHFLQALPLFCESCRFARSIAVKQLHHSRMSLGVLYSQNQQHCTLAGMTKHPAWLWNTREPSLSFRTTLSNAGFYVANEWHSRVPWSYPPWKECAPCLLSSIHLAPSQAQLKVWIPPAGDRCHCGPVQILACPRGGAQKAHYVRCCRR